MDGGPCSRRFAGIGGGGRPGGCKFGGGQCEQWSRCKGECGECLCGSGNSGHTRPACACGPGQSASAASRSARSPVQAIASAKRANEGTAEKNERDGRPVEDCEYRSREQRTGLLIESRRHRRGRLL